MFAIVCSVFHVDRSTLDLTLLRTISRIHAIPHRCRNCCDNSPPDNHIHSVRIFPPATTRSSRAYRINRYHVVNLVCKMSDSTNSNICVQVLEQSTVSVPHFFPGIRWACPCKIRRTDLWAHNHCTYSNINRFCIGTYPHGISWNTALISISS